MQTPKVEQSFYITSFGTDGSSLITNLVIQSIGLCPHNALKHRINSDFKLIPMENYYFLPGTAIPRVKLQNLSVEQGIKSVRNIHEADVIFISKNTLHKVSTNDYIYGIHKNLVKTYLEHVVGLDNYIVEQLQTVLNNTTSDYIAVNSAARRFFTGESSGSMTAILRNASAEVETPSNTLYRNYHVIESKHVPEISYAINNTAIKLVNEEELIAYLNGDDALTIGATEFNQLAQMFKSSDTENCTLAMEIMANSNYQSSIYYLLRLFKDYENRISASHTRNHVNFKSLLSYLGMSTKTYNWDFDVNKILSTILNKNLLELWMIEDIMQEYSHEVLSYSRSESSVIQIKSFTLLDEFAKYLNVNYVKVLKEDFIPEPEEKEEEVIEVTQESSINDSPFEGMRWN